MTTQEFNDDELVDEYSKNYNDDNIPLSQNMQRHARIYGVEKTSPALLMRWAQRARELEQKLEQMQEKSIASPAHPNPCKHCEYLGTDIIDGQAADITYCTHHGFFPTQPAYYVRYGEEIKLDTRIFPEESLCEKDVDDGNLTGTVAKYVAAREKYPSWHCENCDCEEEPPVTEGAMAAHPHPGYCVRWGVENGMDGRRFRQPAFAEAIRQASVLAEALALMCQPAPWFVQVEGRGRILFEVKGYPGA